MLHTSLDRSLIPICTEIAAEVQRLQAPVLGNRGARSIAGQEWSCTRVPLDESIGS